MTPVGPWDAVKACEVSPGRRPETGCVLMALADSAARLARRSSADRDIMATIDVKQLKSGSKQRSRATRSGNPIEMCYSLTHFSELQFALLCSPCYDLH